MRLYPTFYRDATNDSGSAATTAQAPAVPPSAPPANPPASPPPATSPTTPPPAAPVSLSLEDISKLLDARQARAENSAIRSLVEQSGLSEEEVKALFEKAKAEKAKQLPEPVKKQIEEATAKANAKLIAAEVKTLGATMGLVDADDALKLWDSSKIKVTDDGTVEGVKEALEALKEKKPHLFGSARPAGAMAEKMGGQGAKPEKTPQEEARELMYHK